MPVFFWGDEDGTRLHDSYFAEYSGIWRHGDWIRITSRGSCVIEGRSDATLNRGGVRMGTAEFYRVVESLPEVADSLVVDTSTAAGEGDLLLFVVLSHGYGMETHRAAWIAIFLTALMRLLAIRFNWTTHAVRSWIQTKNDTRPH